jgi:hypothetical protein
MLTLSTMSYSVFVWREKAGRNIFEGSFDVVTKLTRAAPPVETVQEKLNPDVDTLPLHWA